MTIAKKMKICSETNFTLALAVICLFAFFTLGIANLKRFPIGNDEYNSLSHIQHPEKGTIYNLAETVQSVAQRSQQHGPLYFLFLNAWRTIAGADVFALRLFSLLFGLLCISVAGRFAAACRDRQLGNSALLVMTFLAYHLFYSGTARMYTVLPLFAALVLWSYWTVLRSAVSAPLWLWTVFFASTALLLYLHYFGIMLLGALGLYHLLFVEKNRRWWRISLAVTVAGLCFLPWLPVAIDGFNSRLSLAGARLPMIDSLLTVLQVFSNGLFFIPLAAFLFAALNHRRLTDMERYILVVTAITLLLSTIANEFTPILVARRMRYMTLLALPIACSVAIGLRFMPRWRLIRVPLLILWIVAFAVFLRSEEMFVYANKRVQDLDRIPRYQEFIYESEHLPGHNELILSIHRDTIIPVQKTLTYYRARLSEYAHLVHIAPDKDGNLMIQSGFSTFASLDEIRQNAIGLWIIHDPQQTQLSDMPVYTDWLSQHYHACQRYVDKPGSVIDYYLRADVPCALVTSASPIRIRYENGTVLGNISVEQSADSLYIYLRWLETIDKVYSFSLQVFDAQATKVLQVDQVISGEPVDILQFDITSLAAGEYSAKLIVYDFESGVSQPGLVVKDGLRFERDIDVYRFSLAA